MTSRVDPKVASAVLDKLDRYGYVHATDTARLIRSALKLAFPDGKFSVRSKSYSGGSSVHVRWVDGPSKDRVDAALSGFAGSDFDGMIDMTFSHDCYMTRAGTVGYAGTRGTAGSMGSVPAVANDVPDGARVVKFLSYISATRDYSRAVTLPAFDDWWAWRDLHARDLPPAPLPVY